MADSHTHCVFLCLPLIFVLLNAAKGIENSRIEHFHRRDFKGKQEITIAKRKSVALRNYRHTNDANKIHVEPNTEANEDIFTEALGQTRSRVILHCDTDKLDPPGLVNLTVIWVKILNDSFTILTDGNRVVTKDKRFYATNKDNPKDWTLHIRYTQWADEGLYKCQLCAQSSSSRSIYVKLKLIEAYAEILGNHVEKVAKVGSPLRLSCELKNSIEAPRYIYWYFGDRVINYDLNDGSTVRDGRQGSELIFPRAEESHSGNYSCVPSNARSASVVVTVSENTSGTENNVKSVGKKAKPQDHIVNMLVLISTFLLHR